MNDPQPQAIRLGPLASAVHQQEVQHLHLAKLITALIVKCGSPDLLSAKRMIKLELTADEYAVAHTTDGGGWLLEQVHKPDGGWRLELVPYDTHGGSQ